MTTLTFHLGCSAVHTTFCPTLHQDLDLEQRIPHPETQVSGKVATHLSITCCKLVGNQCYFVGRESASVWGFQYSSRAAPFMDLLKVSSQQRVCKEEKKNGIIIMYL